MAGCETCRDVAAVTRALQALARTPLPDDARRPDPGLIWWKAHLLKDLAVQPPRFATLLRLQDLVYGLVLALLVGVFWMYGLTWQNTFISASGHPASKSLNSPSWRRSGGPWP